MSTNPSGNPKTHTGELDQENEEANIGLSGIERPCGRFVPRHRLSSTFFLLEERATSSQKNICQKFPALS